MTPEQQAAYIQSQTACALISAAGMTAENKQRALRGESMAYVEEHFAKVIEGYGIHHSAVVSLFEPVPKSRPSFPERLRLIGWRIKHWAQSSGSGTKRR